MESGLRDRNNALRAETIFNPPGGSQWSPVLETGTIPPVRSSPVSMTGSQWSPVLETGTIAREQTGQGPDELVSQWSPVLETGTIECCCVLVDELLIVSMESGLRDRNN